MTVAPTAVRLTSALPPGRLALQDGSVLHGHAFGAVGRGIARAAEVVFNTAMTGYQEALTDPSYAGQILTMTAPLIGNTGVNPTDIESPRVQVAGFVVRELARLYSNFRAEHDLATYLARNGVLGLSGVDTRALTRRLRVAGVMQGIITDDPAPSDADLVAQARTAPSMAGQNLVPLVGCCAPLTWSETLGRWAPDGVPSPTPGARRYRVLAFDCGAKRNILRNLSQRACDVRVVPHTTSTTEVRSMFDSGQADGLFISNGPGDPAAVNSMIATLSDLVQADAPSIPVFGICLGHQLLALALGAKTYKLKFGHRGCNQPVLNLMTGRVEITSQNHGFAVDSESLEQVGGQATHVHLNDGTLAGFRLPDRPVFAVQYHPEASPGPHDSAYLFDTFVETMATGRPPWHDRRPQAFPGVPRRA
jgi:carbamoyl-phosphate synthase small subunit